MKSGQGFAATCERMPRTTPTGHPQCDQHNHQAVGDLLPRPHQQCELDSQIAPNCHWAEGWTVLRLQNFVKLGLRSCAACFCSSCAPCTSISSIQLSKASWGKHPPHWRQQTLTWLGQNRANQGWRDHAAAHAGGAGTQQARNRHESTHMTTQHAACNTSPLVTARRPMGTCHPVGQKDHKSTESTESRDAGTRQAPQQQHEGRLLMHSLFGAL